MTQPSEIKPGEKIIIQADPEIADIIPVFLESRAEDVVSLQEVLGQRDFEAVRILGHSMRGAGGGYGFDAITDIGHALELAAQSQDSEEISRLIDQLSAYLQCVEVVYE